jgi:DNA-binding transcriptional ArsR family regulator
MSKVTLDRDTFKALASETRLQVLHALDERRKTGSELARELDLNKATIHEHLQILESAGLAAKKDEGRKWVYWELTWDGSKLLHPGQGAVFSVLLGLSFLASGGGIFALGRALQWWMADAGVSGLADDSMLTPEGEDGEEPRDTADTADTANASEAPEDATGTPEESLAFDKSAGDGFFDQGGWLAIMLLFTAVMAVAMAVWLRRRR